MKRRLWLVLSVIFAVPFVIFVVDLHLWFYNLPTLLSWTFEKGFFAIGSGIFAFVVAGTVSGFITYGQEGGKS